jgi:hypothetical protein
MGVLIDDGPNEDYLSKPASEHYQVKWTPPSDDKVYRCTVLVQNLPPGTIIDDILTYTNPNTPYYAYLIKTSSMKLKAQNSGSASKSFGTDTALLVFWTGHFAERFVDQMRDQALIVSGQEAQILWLQTASHPLIAKLGS